ncbi:MAG TPA: hypothetical protein VKF62_03695, partial [Planctomycetota bacterium]|nr:hypothetical protein [Planctomycetota bacterium]
MRPPLCSAWALCAFLSAPAPSFAQDASKQAGAEKVKLRLNLRKGDRFAYRYVQDQSTSSGVTRMDSRLHTETEVTFVVEEVAGDGLAWIEARFGAVRGTTSLPGRGE